MQLIDIGTQVHFTVSHHNDTGNSGPVSYRPQRLSDEKLCAAMEEVSFLLETDVVRRSISPWSSPLHIPAKHEPNTWRPCGDC